MNVIRSDSLNDSTLHLPLATHLLLLPCRRSLPCVLFMHLPQSKIYSILTERHTRGSFNTLKRGASWRNLLPCCGSSVVSVCFSSCSQEVCTVPSVTCCQTCRRLASQRCLWKALNARERNHSEVLCWLWGCWTETTRPHSSPIKFYLFSWRTASALSMSAWSRMVDVFEKEEEKKPAELCSAGSQPQHSALNIHAFLVRSSKADKHKQKRHEGPL